MKRIQIYSFGEYPFFTINIWYPDKDKQYNSNVKKVMRVHKQELINAKYNLIKHWYIISLN